MKKIAILVLLALVATGAFAQIGLSAGGGVIMDYSGNNGLKVDSDKAGMNIFSIGGFVFFDATYAELDIAFAYGSLTAYEKGNASMGGSGNAGSMMQLSFSLLGKYPIEMGAITIFPLLGIDYNIALSAKDEDGNEYKDYFDGKNSDFNQFGLLAGVGLDFNLTDSLYLRGEALFHLRFPMKFMKDFADMVPVSVNKTLGVGPQIKLALGYKF